jgi:hypothetical protein
MRKWASGSVACTFTAAWKLYMASRYLPSQGRAAEDSHRLEEQRTATCQTTSPAGTAARSPSFP